MKSKFEFEFEIQIFALHLRHYYIYSQNTVTFPLCMLFSGGLWRFQFVATKLLGFYP